MAEEWSPWIEHDGKSCPVKGKFCHMEFKNPVRPAFYIGGGVIQPDGTVKDFAKGGPSWFHDSGYNPVLRYRIRKPRGLTILQEIAADPQPIKESERVE